MSWFQQFRNEVLSSVKMVEIEERYDLVFSRPFGLLFAKIAARLHMTPTQVSLLSMTIGVGGGVLLLFSDHYSNVIIACIALVLAGILDSSDGQLARMTNQGTELGRVIDGIVDNVVFIIFYVCAAIYLIPELGFFHIIPLAALGGAAHSWKSSAYEFHKSEYLYYAGGYTSSKIPTPKEVEANFDRSTWFRYAVYVVYLDYCKKQQNTGFRPTGVRRRLQELSTDPNLRARFVELYSEYNQRMLFWWAWVAGSNVQRAGIIISLLFGRFDIYLYINTLSVIPFYFIGKAQERADRNVLQAVNKP
ncbi:MAG: CDP-alcohol phosphatidyltransferase family protein [Balneolales bacterium]|nr:CDP-alcohol phosphatidyltransferase family protein [Balneolales bacterium]